MIVRIQGGQYRLDATTQGELEAIDAQLAAAVGHGDDAAAHTLLGQAIALVQDRGAALDATDLSPSDLILPPADASLDETGTLLRAEGLLT
jgi:hypothetical protein